jgi:Txe/YoeB family toxin of toxin-antitoxin system
MGPARVQGFRLRAVLATVRAGGKQKAQALLDLLAENPHQQTPAYEALVADLRGACYRRINIQHRLVYQVQEVEQTVKVLRMWTHYLYALIDEVGQSHVPVQINGKRGNAILLSEDDLWQRAMASAFC